MTDDEVAAVVRGRARAASASWPRMRAAPNRSACACATASTSSTTRPTPTSEALDMLEARKDRVFVAPALSRHRHAARTRPASSACRRSDAMRARIERDLERTIEAMKATEGARRARAARRRLRLHVESARPQRARPRRTSSSCWASRRWRRSSAPPSWGGEIMGMPDELGQVREGYLADLLLVDGDPLADLALLRGPRRACSRS